MNIFNKLHKKMLMFLFFIGIYAKVFAGSLVLVDIPQEMVGMLNATQEKIEQHVNKEGDDQVKFAKLSYPPHMTLAFITPAKFTLKELLEKYPKLETIIEEVAKSHTIVDLTDNANNATINFWKSNPDFPTTFADQLRKNYYNVVIKLESSDKLNKLAENLREKFEKLEGYKKSPHPFSAHVLVGRIYRNDDSELPPHKLIKGLEDKKAVELVGKKVEEFIIDQLKLKADDDQEKIFELEDIEEK